MQSMKGYRQKMYNIKIIHFLLYLWRTKNHIIMKKPINEAQSTNKEITFKPPTQEEIMLIQPNNVTFGQYHVTEWQEDFLTLVSDKLQKHMTRKEDFPTDLFGQPYVEIITSEITGNNKNKTKVLAELKELRTKTFSFKWLHPRMGKQIETSGVMITTVHNVKGKDLITANINPWAIPFLLYYGVGVGGTRFSKLKALTLRGNYTKRLYKIICSQRDRAEYYYPIDAFKKDMEIPETKTNAQLRRDILEPSKERIKESCQDVWFDYEMICRAPLKGRKPKDDTIVLKIHTSAASKEGGNKGEMWYFVYRWMVNCYGSDNPKAQDITDKLSNRGELQTVYERAGYYDDKVTAGEMTIAHAANALKKMLREAYKLR